MNTDDPYLPDDIILRVIAPFMGDKFYQIGRLNKLFCKALPSVALPKICLPWQREKFLKVTGYLRSKGYRMDQRTAVYPDNLAIDQSVDAVTVRDMRQFCMEMGKQSPDSTWWLGDILKYKVFYWPVVRCYIGDYMSGRPDVLIIRRKSPAGTGIYPYYLSGDCGALSLCCSTYRSKQDVVTYVVNQQTFLGEYKKLLDSAYFITTENFLLYKCIPKKMLVMGFENVSYIRDLDVLVAKITDSGAKMVFRENHTQVEWNPRRNMNVIIESYISDFSRYVSSLAVFGIPYKNFQYAVCRTNLEVPHCSGDASSGDTGSGDGCADYATHAEQIINCAYSGCAGCQFRIYGTPEDQMYTDIQQGLITDANYRHWHSGMLIEYCIGLMIRSVLLPDTAHLAREKIECAADELLTDKSIINSVEAAGIILDFLVYSRVNLLPAITPKLAWYILSTYPHTMTSNLPENPGKLLADLFTISAPVLASKLLSHNYVGNMLHILAPADSYRLFDIAQRELGGPRKKDNNSGNRAKSTAARDGWGTRYSATLNKSERVLQTNLSYMELSMEDPTRFYNTDTVHTTNQQRI